MNKQHLTATIVVDKTPKEAFDAILNIKKWWSENIEGETSNIGDEFTYSAKTLHRCRMKLAEAIPNKKITWEVLDNYFSFTNDQTEWVGTKITFDITQEDDKTKVQFTHLGLVPGHECYEVCEGAWIDYITNSLYNLIATGTGYPNSKECEEVV
ncbi:SRPBCC domain-containing protein [Mucilaginibacter sp. L3T2-6]|uniref:SRPBCC family protein n=1 Tax=Mucilaginibacter sp. L3T2-6 TaxID=3062491 RepID=UPI002674D9AD|nr:SRPBCC domain-containing protein [Mucilaginibacter sp. L3T2-6]MDO3641677.1 SRPBCC domain-containing protein [Mucilaginibacter sp. L3T2-6]MDV6214171.1 SRPBCC domain-containing protein [Mucilaginibacter sp. L3T2-6]